MINDDKEVIVVKVAANRKRWLGLGERGDRKGCRVEIDDKALTIETRVRATHTYHIISN